MSRPFVNSEGPFFASQIRDGDPYELSRGHAIHTMGTGGRGSRANLVGGSVLDTDPAVEEAGIDAGYTPSEKTLRAPDIAVGHVPDEPGWIQGAPPLAVEYADTGQDEQELAVKVQELFDAGTRMVWIVRLVGPKRVEVLEPGKKLRQLGPGDQLEAPGLLKNPVPVEALYDRDAAHEVTLRNLLQRRGYEDLDSVRNETLRSTILRTLAARNLEMDDETRERLEACRETETLERWQVRAVTETDVRLVFDG